MVLKPSWAVILAAFAQTATVVGFAAPTKLANAAPQILVRDRSEIIFNPVERVDGGLLLSGRLIESASGFPIVAARVVVQLAGGKKSVAVTDASGTFQKRFAIPRSSALERNTVKYGSEGLSENTVVAVYKGTSFLDGVKETLENFQSQKRTPIVELSKNTSSRNSDNTSWSSRFLVAASSVNNPVALSLTAEVFSISDTRQDSAVYSFTLKTDQEGAAGFDLKTSELPTAGFYRLTVRSDATELFNEAVKTLRFTRKSTTQLVLREVKSAPGRREFSGILRNDAGAGIPSSLVALQVQGNPVAEALTSADGVFTFSIAEEDIPNNESTLVARFSSPVEFLTSSMSEPVFLNQSPRSRLGVALLLGAFFLSVPISMMLFVSRSPRPRPPPARPAARGVISNSPAPPFLSRTKAKKYSIEATVIDGSRSTLVSGATINTTKTGARKELLQELYSDDSGRVVFPDLAAGVYSFCCQHPFYDDENFSVEIPHGGQWSNFQIRLRALRECIFDVYRKAAEPLLNKTGQLPRSNLTPRQMLALVNQHIDASEDLGEESPLATFTTFVEQSYFGKTQATRADFEKAISLARRIATFPVPLL